MLPFIDYLFFGAHPDDVELSCGGTIIEAISRNKKVGIIDLTYGEMGTRGSVTLRQEEAVEAAKMLGLHIRENLGLRDAFFDINEASLRAVIKCLRLYRPRYVFANALLDRHPDHPRGAQLVERACFLSGLKKIDTDGLLPHRPEQLLFYIQDRQVEPTIAIDISPYLEQKKKVIACYASQFYNPDENSTQEENTYISSALFWKHLDAKASAMGQKIGVAYAEGYVLKQVLGLKNIETLLPSFF